MLVDQPKSMDVSTRRRLPAIRSLEASVRSYGLRLAVLAVYSGALQSYRGITARATATTALQQDTRHNAVATVVGHLSGGGRAAPGNRAARQHAGIHRILPSTRVPTVICGAGILISALM